MKEFNIEEYIRNLPWTDNADGVHKTLVAGNLRTLFHHLHREGHSIERPWQPIEEAAHDGEMILVRRRPSWAPDPAWRSLKKCNEDGECEDDGGWVTAAPPDDGGNSCALIYHPDSTVSGWLYRPLMPIRDPEHG